MNTPIAIHQLAANNSRTANRANSLSSAYFVTFFQAIRDGCKVRVAGEVA